MRRRMLPFDCKCSFQQYQQKDQLLEIQSVMAVKRINHNARLEQASCDINSSVDPITSSLHDFIQNRQTFVKVRKLVSFSWITSKRPLDTKLDGGAGRDRTDDPLLAKQVLSQLSYGPSSSNLVGLGGLEPPTPRLSSVCSNQLSYKPLYFRQHQTVSANTGR